jgi:hypothetical protein
MKVGKEKQPEETTVSTKPTSLSPSPEVAPQPSPAPQSIKDIKEYDFSKAEQGGFFKWMSPKWWWHQHKLKQQHRTILVNMELRNGNWITMLVLDKGGGFKYEKCAYRFDDEMKYYNLSAKMWMYDFHQDFSIPLQRKIPIADVQKTVESSGITEVEYATNPATLERFTIAKIAEGIMRGQAIDDFLKQIRLILIITAVAAVIHLFLFMQKTGMLKAIKLPF